MPQNIHQSSKVLVRHKTFLVKACAKFSPEGWGHLRINHSCKGGKYSTVCAFSYLSLQMNHKSDCEILHGAAACNVVSLPTCGLTVEPGNGYGQACTLHFVNVSNLLRRMFSNALFLSRNLTQMIAHAELKKRILGFSIPSKTIYSNIFYLLINI